MKIQHFYHLPCTCAPYKGHLVFPSKAFVITPNSHLFYHSSRRYICHDWMFFRNYSSIRASYNGTHFSCFPACFQLVTIFGSITRESLQPAKCNYFSSLSRCSISFTSRRQRWIAFSVLPRFVSSRFFLFRREGEVDKDQLETCKCFCHVVQV